MKSRWMRYFKKLINEENDRKNRVINTNNRNIEIILKKNLKKI